MPDRIAGEKFKPSASRERELDRLLRDAREGRTGLESPDGKNMPLGHMYAKNMTDQDLDWGTVVMYHGANGFYSTQLAGSGRRDWDMRKDYLELRLPTDLNSNASNPFGGMAFTLEKIKVNEIGRVAVAGLAILNATPVSPGDDNFRYLQPDPDIGSTYSYWGFGRALAWRAGTAVVDLSDRHFQAVYQLTANMASNSANATLGLQGGRTWTTTVHDLHGVAGFQKSGNKGIAEWQGKQWVVKVAYC